MPYTNIIVKTGRDFANLFYNVPENMQPYKAEGEAVSKIVVNVYVEGMMFYSEEFRFCGGSPSKAFGKITIPELGESEYAYKVTESVISISKDSYVDEEIQRNTITGSFIIADGPVEPIRSAKVVEGCGCTN